MENIEVNQQPEAEKELLNFLDVQKGNTYTIEKWGEVYEVRVDTEPTNPDEIQLKRTTPGALLGQPQTVSLDELNRMLVQKEG
ncbi:MAG: hypothetical protein KBB86_02395 [Candidatus Pacebacteria bacterium]|nr:hypothetical protein [Candidatus Paceibacterota bacterium]